ncbi:MAG: hypothetical protein EHM13_12065, partial [Acidobacteria bacterium]
PSSFVLLDRLPLTATGKLDRTSVAASTKAAPLPSSDAAHTSRPGTAAEETMKELWREVLRLSRVELDDDFFDLGGDSLQAVRLFAAVRDRFGKSLPLATLFQASTVRRLAAAVEEHAGDARSALVPIRAAGTAPPFFCVHPVGGEVLCYEPLARRLGPDQPFYGLRAISDDVERDQPGIEDLARKYVRSVKSLQREGPYLIGGYSLGGQIAFEMARRMRANGDHVALLAIIDSAPRSACSRPSLARLFLNAARRLPSWLADGHFLAKLRFWRWRIAAALFDASVPGQAQMPDEIAEMWFPEDRIPLVRALAAARDRYVPGPYDGRLTLFRPKAVPLLSGEDPEVAWRRLAKGGVDVRILPGSHMRILSEPAVESLATQLAGCLDAALKRPVSRRASRLPCLQPASP